MAKRYKMTTAPANMGIHKPSESELTEKYKEDYEFKKPGAYDHTGRSPVSKWEEKWIKEAGDTCSIHSKIEKDMVCKKPHCYGHEPSQRKGALRMSGHKGAHRLGARKGKK